MVDPLSGSIPGVSVSAGRLKFESETSTRTFSAEELVEGVERVIEAAVLCIIVTFPAEKYFV